MSRLRLLLVSAFAVSTLGLSGDTLAQQTGTPARTRQGRAVSLRVLQDWAITMSGYTSLPDEVVHLGRLARVIGYVVDEANRDLILVGEVDDSMPPLYLSDFAVALRCEWGSYIGHAGPPGGSMQPGCSIDPDPAVLEQLNRISNRIGKDKDCEELGAAWREICRAPQTVRVLGVPWRTRFAKIMVIADYDMKSLVNGSELVDIPGFLSLTDMRDNVVNADIANGRDISLASNSMNRFWFYPGVNNYRWSRGVVIIDECRVKLLTEEQFLTTTGSLGGTGQPDPLAGAFAESLTRHYDELARVKPIYQELENLFRFVALAKIIHLRDAFEEAGMEPDYLLEDYPVPPAAVSKQLPGRSHIKKQTHRRDVTDGYELYEFCFATCGGVGMDIIVSDDSFVDDVTGGLRKFRANVIGKRPSSRTLAWDLREDTMHAIGGSTYR